jgi:hypothetical protein
MATDKKHIAVYLDPAVEAALVAFCEQKGLKSKKGTMFSAGVNAALAQFFGIVDIDASNIRAVIPDNILATAPSNIRPAVVPDNIRAVIPDNIRAVIPDNILATAPSNIRAVIPDNICALIPDNIRAVIPDNILATAPSNIFPKSTFVEVLPGKQKA